MPMEGYMNSEDLKLNRYIHRTAAAVVFILPLLVYLRTVAPTISFWDCGEYVSCAYTLGIAHPPGVPLYTLITRIWTLLPVTGDIGLRVNLFSVFCSAGALVFMYLALVQFMRQWREEPRSWIERLILYGAAAFGSFAFAFTDAFWFNAVESEVYAPAILLTTLIVWLTLVWESQSGRQGSIRVLFMALYLFALLIGIHHVNLLAFSFVFTMVILSKNPVLRRLFLLIAGQIMIPILLYMILYQFNPSRLSYETIAAHQAGARTFLKICGLICMGASLVFVYIRDRTVFKLWCVTAGIGLIGATTYLFIFIRAGQVPPVNVNDPATWKGMMDYLARRQYFAEDALLTFLYRKADFLRTQIGFLYFRYFGWQFIGKGNILDPLGRVSQVVSLRGLYGVPFILGFWGAMHHFHRDWKRALAVLSLLVMTGIAVIVYVNQPELHPRERHYFYTASYLAFAFWAGIGFAGAMEEIVAAFKKRKILMKTLCVALALLLFIMVPVNTYIFNVKTHDRTGHRLAHDFAYNLLESCEPNAILFTSGDNDTYPLWYLQNVENIRRDVRVVNLNMLNSVWFIRQLRDVKPVIPLDMNNQDIEALKPIEWDVKQVEIPVPADIREPVSEAVPETREDFPEDKIVFTVNPTLSFPPGIRVQDLMILRILQKTAWERPVYFAATVKKENRIGLDDYLRLDGLVLKLTPYRWKGRVSRDILSRNLFEIYRYRGLDDTCVYLDHHDIELLHFYRTAFMMLAVSYNQDKLNDKAQEVLNQMEEILPEKHVPYTTPVVSMYAAHLYQESGLPPNVEERIESAVANKAMKQSDRIKMARLYVQFFQKDNAAEAILLKLFRNDPNNRVIYADLCKIYDDNKQYNKKLLVIQDWMKRNPWDKAAAEEAERLEEILNSEI